MPGLFLFGTPVMVVGIVILSDYLFIKRLSIHLFSSRNKAA